LLDRTQPDPSLNNEDASPLDRDRVADDKRAAKRAGGGRSAGCAAPGSSSSRSRSPASPAASSSLNLAGLVALVASILYLSQFRAGLIDARAQSLLVQGEIIAGAIAASATVETNTITIDPDRCST
jgi:two-component system sensor histidine kinase ChvG